LPFGIFRASEKQSRTELVVAVRKNVGLYANAIAHATLDRKSPAVNLGGYTFDHDAAQRAERATD
jgi:hypothetical protein